MAATTISDLPRDALVLIFRAAFDAANADDLRLPMFWGAIEQRKKDIHKNLRRVCRKWRDAADVAFIEQAEYSVSLRLHDAPDPATVRLRLPSLIRRLSVDCSLALACSAPITRRALSSLCTSPDLRRALKRVELAYMCCADAAAAVVSAIVACPHLTYVGLHWGHRGHAYGDWPDMLAPLGALTGLKNLKLQADDAASPTLPDSTALTSLALLRYNGTFAPVGSDASFGRLRHLDLWNKVTIGADAWWASNDPFGLRANLDAGLWRPHLLTNLQKLGISMICDVHDPDHDEDFDPREYDGASPAAAVWAPLVPTVTELDLYCESCIYRDSDLETGMYAGLGVLTGLQALIVVNVFDDEGVHPHRRCIDFERVHLPHLTVLSVRGHLGRPIDVARFPRLVQLEIASEEPQPLVLSSALGRLASLRVSGLVPSTEWHIPDGTPRLNLAQLFGGGRPRAALTELSFERVDLEWDNTAVAGAPPAAEFAACAGALLPSLRLVEINERVDMDDEVEEFVVRPMLALDGVERKIRGKTTT